MLWIFAERFFMAALRQCEKSEGCFAVFTAQPWTAAVLFKLQFSDGLLVAIRKRGGQYLVGTPRRQMKRFEAELVKEDWTRVRPEVEVKKVAIPQGEETYILCRTAGRREKEKAIRERFCSRMEEALKRLEKTMATGRLKNRNLMERRLGKIQARHPSVNDLYEISLRETGEGVRL